MPGTDVEPCVAQLQRARLYRQHPTHDAFHQAIRVSDATEGQRLPCLQRAQGERAAFAQLPFDDFTAQTRGIAAVVQHVDPSIIRAASESQRVSRAEQTAARAIEVEIGYRHE